MVKNVEDWKWSSCQKYYGVNSYPETLLDKEYILGMFSMEDTNVALARFREFNEATNNDICLDDEPRLRITDEEARNEIIKRIDGIAIAQVKGLPRIERDKIFREVKGIETIPQRQAARIFGVSSSLIFKA
jgi:hypothetical protein